MTADWATPAFDLGQIRHVRFPLPDGTITEAAASSVRATLLAGIKHQLGQASVLHAILPGFPGMVDDARTARFRRRVDELRRVSAELNTIRLADRSKRVELALAARERLAPLAASSLPIALELIYLLRDVRDWTRLVAFIEWLPLEMRSAASVQEQLNLERSEQGDHLTSIAALQELIRTDGDSSERRGLLGGRYKRLFDSATDSIDRERYLDLAIEAYSQGMLLDLNDYYPMSNLARLLRIRGEEGDEERATAAAAFHLDTTIVELQRAVAMHADEALRASLTGILESSRDLLPAPSSPG